MIPKSMSAGGLRIGFVVLLSFITSLIAAQMQSQKDSVYILVCRTALENGRPETGFILYQNLDSLPNLSVVTTEQDAICTLLQHSIWFEEPAFTLASHLGDYGFSSKQEGDKFLDSLSQKVKELSKKYTGLYSKKFADGKTIQIDCAHLVGDFWLIDSKSHTINTLNHSIKVPVGCYLRPYWYNLKNIDISQELSCKEALIVQAKLGRRMRFAAVKLASPFQTNRFATLRF
jgi:hypothetical protein